MNIMVQTELNIDGECAVVEIAYKWAWEN